MSRDTLSRLRPCEPSVLYRYRPLPNKLTEQDKKYIENEIVNNELYFTKVSDWNDPFDCHPRIVLGEGLRNREQRINEYIKSVVRSQKELFPDIDVEKTIKKMKISMRDPDYLNNSLLPKTLDIYGFICLSEENDSVLMWGHYASNHGGICIEYSIDFLIDPFDRCFKVNYEKTRPKLDLIITRNDANLLLDSFYIKSLDWQYEKEWRVMRSLNRYSNPHIIENGHVLAVILGATISEENRKFIYECLEQRTDKLKIKQARLHEEIYKLRIEDI